MNLITKCKRYSTPVLLLSYKLRTLEQIATVGSKCLKDGEFHRKLETRIRTGFRSIPQGQRNWWVDYSSLLWEKKFEHISRTGSSHWCQNNYHSDHLCRVSHELETSSDKDKLYLFNQKLKMRKAKIKSLNENLYYTNLTLKWVWRKVLCNPRDFPSGEADEDKKGCVEGGWRSFQPRNWWRWDQDYFQVKSKLQVNKLTKKVYFSG